MMHADGDELIVCTRHGHRVPLFTPDPESIDIQDIACGLARRYRWSAQVDLTVAQHSVNVSTALSPPARGHVSPRIDLARWGLLHDAAEAYLVDVPRSLKTRLLVRIYNNQSHDEHFGDVEDRLLRAIGERFGLPWPVPQAVWIADDREMCREARDLWGDPTAAVSAPAEPIAIMPQALAEAAFLRRFSDLFGEVAP